MPVPQRRGEGFLQEPGRLGAGQKNMGRGQAKEQHIGIKAKGQNIGIKEASTDLCNIIRVSSKKFSH